MKKIKKLNQNLEKLESQKTNLDSLENTSLLQFLKQKNILTRQSKIKRKIEKIKTLENEINFLYDSKTKSWIENPNINCRKYHKLEELARYKKNSQLYKIGILDKKPLPPPLEKIINRVSPQIEKTSLFLDNFNIFKILNIKSKYFISNILPKKIDNLAIQSAKTCIRGYQNLQKNIKYIQKNVSNTQTAKYIAKIKNEAHKQLNTIEKAKNFKESIRINPVYLNCQSNKHSAPISKSYNPFSKNEIELNL